MGWTVWDYIKVGVMAGLCVSVIVAIKLLPIYLT